MRKLQKSTKIANNTEIANNTKITEYQKTVKPAKPRKSLKPSKKIGNCSQSQKEMKSKVNQKNQQMSRLWISTNGLTCCCLATGASSPGKNSSERTERDNHQVVFLSIYFNLTLRFTLLLITGERAGGPWASSIAKSPSDLISVS